MGFTQSLSGALGGIGKFIQVIPTTYKNDIPVNITGIDKFHLKCDCVNGSILNDCREPVLYNFGLTSPLGYKIYKEPRIKLFKNINQSVLSHVSFYLENGVYKPVEFNNETISFTCQLVRI